MSQNVTIEIPQDVLQPARRDAQLLADVTGRDAYAVARLVKQGGRPGVPDKLIVEIAVLSWRIEDRVTLWHATPRTLAEELDDTYATKQPNEE